MELEGAPRLRLNPEDSRSGGFAEVLDGLRRQGVPAYVEFEPRTAAVTGIRIPYMSPVVGIRVVDRGVFDVVLATSHSRHLLREAPRTTRDARAP